MNGGGCLDWGSQNQPSDGFADFSNMPSAEASDGFADFGGTASSDGWGDFPTSGNSPQSPGFADFGSMATAPSSEGWGDFPSAESSGAAHSPGFADFSFSNTATAPVSDGATRPRSATAPVFGDVRNKAPQAMDSFADFSGMQAALPADDGIPDLLTPSHAMGRSESIDDLLN